MDKFGLHLLELATDRTDVMCLASLRPSDTTAAAASKLKGQTSKWLRQVTDSGDSEKLLSRGYFAVTTGHSTGEAVQAYLQAQAEHHGYDDRYAKPPVFVESYPPIADDRRLQAAHSHTLLRLHCVLATWRRRGVFTQALAADITAAWRQSANDRQFALDKVSFVADHVHVAVRIHPSVSPATLLCVLMNRAQEVAVVHFRRMVQPPAVEQLWQPSAYLGSFGDLASPQIACYLTSWRADRET